MKHQPEAVEFRAHRSIAATALRIAIIVLSVGGIAAVGKVLVVDVLRSGWPTHDARALLNEHAADAAEHVEAIVALTRDATDTIRALRTLAQSRSPYAEDAQHALDAIDEALR